MKIGLFGITANPPHLGHLAVINEALKEVDEVWVSLVFKHPFGKNFIDYDDRLKMLNLLLEKADLSRVKIKEIDKQYFDLYNKIPYSYNLLSLLKKDDPEKDFKLIIGEDNYKKEVWEKFYEHEKIEENFGLVIIKDTGLHSTNLRERNKNNIDISENVGVEVSEYIKKNKLYKM